MIMEKRNVADLVNLRCEEWSRYNKCLMRHCCWFLCLSRGEYKREEAREHLKLGTLPGFFIQLKEQLHQQRI
jgi:hypothetical protein